MCVWKDSVRSWSPDYSAAPHADAISTTASQEFGVIAGLDSRVTRKARHLQISAICDAAVFAGRVGRGFLAAADKREVAGFDESAANWGSFA